MFTQIKCIFTGQWEKQYIRDQFKKLTTFTCLKSLEYAPNKICDDRVDCIHFFKQPEPTSCELDFRFVLLCYLSCTISTLERLLDGIALFEQAGRF